MSKGYIYVLYNPIYDYYGEVYKIGQTIDLNSRLNSYSTSYPEKSVIKYSIQNHRYKQIEKEVHKKLQQYRLKGNREYFKCSLQLIKDTLDEYKDEVIPQQEEHSNENKDEIVPQKEESLNENKDEVIPQKEESSNKNKYKIYNNNKRYDCELCKKSFGKKYNLERHQPSCKKQEIITSFKCELCLKSYSSKWYLEAHKCKAYDNSKKNKIAILEETLKDLKQKVYKLSSNQSLFLSKSNIKNIKIADKSKNDS